MSSLAEEVMAPPGYRFRPSDRQLVKNYLLPRARGQNPFPGVIVEDDAAACTLPWELFARHDLGSEDEAYFLAVSSGGGGGKSKKRGAREERGCAGGVGVWKIQNSEDKDLSIGGETVRCRRSNLNLHMGKGQDGGSVGWVMHEYTIAEPPCPLNVKICHIAFTGHGRKRKRVPDGQEGRHAVAAAAPCGSAVFVYPSCGDQELPHGSSSDLQGFPSAASVASAYAQQYPGTREQQQVIVPQLTAAGEAGFCRSLGAGDGQEDRQTAYADDAFGSAPSCIGAMTNGHEFCAVYAPSGGEELPQLVHADGDSFPPSHPFDSSGFVGFSSATSVSATNGQQCLGFPTAEQQVSAMPEQLTAQQSGMTAEEVGLWSSLMIDIESDI